MDYNQVEMEQEMAQLGTDKSERKKLQTKQSKIKIKKRKYGKKERKEEKLSTNNISKLIIKIPTIYTPEAAIFSEIHFFFGETNTLQVYYF